MFCVLCPYLWCLLVSGRQYHNLPVFSFVLPGFICLLQFSCLSAVLLFLCQVDRLVLCQLMVGYSGLLVWPCDIIWLLSSGVFFLAFHLPLSPDGVCLIAALRICPIVFPAPILWGTILECQYLLILVLLTGGYHTNTFSFLGNVFVGSPKVCPFLHTIAFLVVCFSVFKNLIDGSAQDIGSCTLMVSIVCN